MSRFHAQARSGETNCSPSGASRLARNWDCEMYDSRIGPAKSGKNKEPTCQTTKPRGAPRTGPRSMFKNNMKWITGAGKFGVTPDQLRNAVKRVGPSAAAVERELQRST